MLVILMSVDCFRMEGEDYRDSEVEADSDHEDEDQDMQHLHGGNNPHFNTVSSRLLRSLYC